MIGSVAPILLGCVRMWQFFQGLLILSTKERNYIMGGVWVLFVLLAVIGIIIGNADHRKTQREKTRYQKEARSLSMSLEKLKRKGRRVDIEYNDKTIDHWNGNYTYVKDEAWKKQVADMTHSLHLLHCKC